MEVGNWFRTKKRWSILVSDNRELEREDRRFEDLQGESRQENDPEPVQRSPVGRVERQHLTVILNQRVGLRPGGRCGSLGRRAVSRWKWGDESRVTRKGQNTRRKIAPNRRMMRGLQTETYIRDHNEKKCRQPVNHSPALPSGSVINYGLLIIRLNVRSSSTFPCVPAA